MILGVTVLGSFVALALALTRGSFRLFLCWFSVCRGLWDFFSGNGVWLRSWVGASSSG